MVYTVNSDKGRDCSIEILGERWLNVDIRFDMVKCWY